MSNNNQNTKETAGQVGQSINHCYMEFIDKFGKWSCPENCKIQDLPFIKDIEIFLNSIDNKINNLQAINAMLIDSNNALYELQNEV